MITTKPIQLGPYHQLLSLNSILHFAICTCHEKTQMWEQLYQGADSAAEQQFSIRAGPLLIQFCAIGKVPVLPSEVKLLI